MDKDREEQIIENYKQQEKTMILVYAQWCVNEGLDPKEVYKEAYPMQPNNPVLEEVLEFTVPPKESDEISDATLFAVLQAFGNDDLAFTVQSYIEKRED